MKLSRIVFAATCVAFMSGVALASPIDGVSQPGGNPVNITTDFSTHFSGDPGHQMPISTGDSDPAGWAAYLEKPLTATLDPFIKVDWPNALNPLNLKWKETAGSYALDPTSNKGSAAFNMETNCRADIWVLGTDLTLDWDVDGSNHQTGAVGETHLANSWTLGVGYAIQDTDDTDGRSGTIWNSQAIPDSMVATKALLSGNGRSFKSFINVNDWVDCEKESFKIDYTVLSPANISDAHAVPVDFENQSMRYTGALRLVFMQP